MRTYAASLTILIIALVLPFNAMADKVVGTLAVVKGQVEIKEKSGKSTPAKMGSKVKEKDTIVCGKDSRAKLVMMDQNVLNLSPETEVNLETYKFEPEKNEKNVVLNVLYGKVRSTVNQKYDGEENKFNVKTPAAVAGVRGTDFLAGYNESNKQSNFVTFKGMVQVGTLGPGGAILNPVSVGPGMATTAAVGAPPAAPAAVPKSELAQMNKESTADGTGKTDHRDPANDNKGDSKSKGGNNQNNNTAPKGPAPAPPTGSSTSSATAPASSTASAPAPAAAPTTESAANAPAASGSTSNASSAPTPAAAPAAPTRDPASVTMAAPPAGGVPTPAPMPSLGTTSGCTFCNLGPGAGGSAGPEAPPPPPQAAILPLIVTPILPQTPVMQCPPICPPTGKAQLNISISVPH